MGAAQRRQRQPAVAADDGGQPLAQFQRTETGAEQRRVGVAVDVDKAGGHQLARSVDDAAGFGLSQLSHGGNASALHSHIGPDGGRTRSVQDHSVLDQQGIHDNAFCLFY